ncbi:MAG: diguanylate cyclase [Deltaproteobacteria bacterium]|nr:diguanylate cyclase [Deltaproteobacteria bacterium]
MTQPTNRMRRISSLLEVTRALRDGRFQVDLPEGPDDEFGELGEALAELGKTLERRVDEVQRLLKLTERVNQALLLGDALDVVWESFRSVIPYDRLGCALIDDTGTRVRSVWMRSTAQEAVLENGYEAPLAGSSLERILDTGEPRILEDLEAYLAAHPGSESTRLILREGIRSSLTCPLASMGKPVGFLFFSSMRPRTYAARHVSVFMTIAGQISTIVEKSRLFEELLRAKQELDEANQKLAQVASVDPLTEIPNRRTLDERLAREWRRAARSGRAVSLLVIDIDHFKEYNDRHGHLAGDESLKAVARCLATSLRRGGDFVARYGGEEFVVVLPETDERGLPIVAEYLRQRVMQLEIDHGASSTGEHLTISLGGAVAVPGAVPEVEPSEALARADAALYEAKKEGRNRIRVHRPPTGEELALRRRPTVQLDVSAAGEGQDLG